MKPHRLAIAALALVSVLSGCDWMGYTAHVGTWVYAYETVDDFGDPLLVEERMTFDGASGFTFVESYTFADTSEAFTQTRGSVVVAGERMFFTAEEIGFDPTTMAAYEFILALEGLTWSYSGAEWMDIPGFIAETAQSEALPEFTAEDFELGEGTHRISGSVLYLSVGPINGEFVRV